MWKEMRRWLRRSIIGMDDFEISVREMVEEYQDKLTGENRFLLNLKILRTVYPTESRFEVFRIWKMLKDDGLVEQDILDGEWKISRRV